MYTEIQKEPSIIGALYDRLEIAFSSQLYSHCVFINNLYKTWECPRGEIGRHKGLKNLLQ